MLFIVNSKSIFQRHLNGVLVLLGVDIGKVYSMNNS